MSPAISIVDACRRDGHGGSPTAVVEVPAAVAGVPGGPASTGAAPGDAALRRIPARFGTSHAVLVTRRDPRHRPGAPARHDGDIPAGDPTVDLRFFTAEGELPACGHGTVAALAVLARGRRAGKHEFRLRASGRTFTGRTVRDGDRTHAAFDPGPVSLRAATPAELGSVLRALRVPAHLTAPGACVATLGRARILVPVATPAVTAALDPDLAALRAVCDRWGLLGCYVHSVPTSAGRVAARMFAPSIGVPEDVANANSTACLAAHLAGRGSADLTVDMGDSLGRPATVTAAVRRGPSGPAILVGGSATVTGQEGMPVSAVAAR